MRRSYKFLLAPTQGQRNRFQQCLDDQRGLYNAALQERRDAYKHPQKVKISFGGQSAQLPEIRVFDPDGQGRWGSGSQQATLRRLDRSFASFFDRVKKGAKGKRVGYPRFKGAGYFDTVTWPSPGDGCKWNSTPDNLLRVYLKGIGHVKVRAHREVVGTIKTISLKREGVGRKAKWFVVLSCDNVPTEFLLSTGTVVGVDMGVASFLTTSDCSHVPNPRFVRTTANDLAAAQQALSRKKRGSKNRARARAKVAAIHAKTRRQRTDFHHKTALDLVRSADLIVVEDLRVANMTRSASGTVAEPGTNVAAKSGLNKSILDAGWSTFFLILSAKAESAGRTMFRVNAANTSRTCPACQHVSADNRPTQALFLCTRCGFTGHADVVAAGNILRRGIAP